MKKNFTRTRKGIKSWKLILTLTILFITTLGVKAQVTIGDGTPPQKFSVLEIVSNSEGGLRLPQLSTDERNAITDVAFKSNSLAQGLSIFNTTTKCFEYWNNTRWVSLCKGDAEITFTVDIFSTAYPCEGGTSAPTLAKSSDNCQTFDFLVVVGESFTSVKVDPATKELVVSVARNTTATSRNAVIRVTNKCTEEYKEFILVQDACTDICQPSAPKQIIAANATDMCAAGAVYLHVVSPIIVGGGKYIWTVDGEEITEYRGKRYCVATKSGAYKLYLGAIGCESNASDPLVVTLSGTTAPPGVGSVSVTNHGVICVNGKVILTAHNVPSVFGSLVWFKDGKETTRTENPLTLSSPSDVGDWYAVMKSGTCFSSPSTIIPVSYNNNATALPEPVVFVNGSPLNTVILCKDGEAVFDIINKPAYSTAEISWYDGNILIGKGLTLTYKVTTNVMSLRCVATDMANVYCETEVYKSIPVSGNTPPVPSIIGSTEVCTGQSVVLTAGSSSGATSYKWYYEGTLLPSVTGSTYNASQAGSYTVQAVSASNCISAHSIPHELALGVLPSVQFHNPPSSTPPNSTVSFSVTSMHATSYIWTVAGLGGTSTDASFVGGGTTIETSDPWVSLKVNAVGTHTVTCKGVNKACGTGVVATTDIQVVAPVVCNPPGLTQTGITIVPGSTVMEGTGFSLTVTPSGTGPFVYTWMRDGVVISGATNTTTSSTYSVASATQTHAGVYTVDITSQCGSTPSYITSNVATITVTGDPGNIVVDDAGVLKGQVCFDVNLSNYQSGAEACGLKSERLKADFSKKYTYSFLNVGTGNKNLRWEIVEPEVNKYLDRSQSTITNVPGALVNGVEYKIDLKFKPEIDNLVLGDKDGKIVKVYAIYTVADGTERSKVLNIVFKDCRCACGANTTAGIWLVFMCHDLGTDETLSPLVPNPALMGDYFQWGRRRDGHEKSTSTAIQLQAMDKDATTPYQVIGTFLATARGDGTENDNKDWLQGDSPFGRWGDGTATSLNPLKGPTDPCPAGWKVPSAANWESIYGGPAGGRPDQATANVTRWINSWDLGNVFGGSGVMIGTSLFLPANGYRKTWGEPWEVGTQSAYWTSNIGLEEPGTARVAIYGRSMVSLKSGEYGRASGRAVRCILDQ
ncbi:hypothetical protein JGH11_15515 [Dysgonomonas sp. Marseille-P4677]|uniref:Ig-like domain-containing protein n=1 Tax=Dysgonomonas sp. Marseille-P4677 TaxID=2364790 RepID=UPI0019138C5F|nr:hypothetical protein [Dysgonomonas sp. Marseille-P4677]MBK5722284.1 hypothetical protein [Dysgonomonas sp. Marseille-P4677]